ncbi:uncharacterized protein LOC133837623 [Drosophila sulfurigaster albostrigata]|uniref:uncharacterized protein LOC133837623 n=1 Tax=Drosophila sulfurigaster albostrigata TaxID=89887 RepID=UPI002D21B6BA|nr:uncharacterized protein LOC133837623 [Drosophila sulfurigaster albostrigata]
MKFFQLLLSLFLAIVLCTMPLIKAQEIPPIPTAAPTPPNGEAGAPAGPDGPPTAPTTIQSPEVSTIYPNYAGK